MFEEESVEAPSGFEPEMEVLQTSALPLGYGAVTPLGIGEGKMERETGFEPATSTLARSHSTTELFPPKRVLKVPHETASRQERVRPARDRSDGTPAGPRTAGNPNPPSQLRRSTRHASPPGQ